jgi:C4-dicarboxylate-specific signal transduction histidine kinase
MAIKTFWEGVHSGQGFAFETRSLRAKDGIYRRHLQQAVSLRDAEGKVLRFVGATTDIDDQKRAEETLRQTQSELAHVARVATVNAMTASIAHEVSQPLSGILINANTSLRMLATETPNVAGAVETAQRTIRDAKRASEVVKRLREMFSNKEPVIELVDLNNTVREVIAIAGDELTRRSARLQTELADDLPALSANRVQLQQVILNLLLNAADAMDEIEDRPRSLLVRTELESDGVARLEVRDAGTGFDPASAGKLFEPFHSTKPNGMGIGLAICRTIIESHKGRLWASPNEGPGATFSFSIPVLESKLDADKGSRFNAV